MRSLETWSQNPRHCALSSFRAVMHETRYRGGHLRTWTRRIDPLRLPWSVHGPRPRRASSHPLSMTDADALDGSPGFGGLGDGKSKHAILKGRHGGVQIEPFGQGHRALDRAEAAFAQDIVLLFGLAFGSLLATNRYRSVGKADLYIRRFHAGQLGLDLDLLVRLADVDFRRAVFGGPDARGTGQRQVKPAPKGFEGAIDIPLQCADGICIFAANRDFAFAPVPRDEFFDIHHGSLLHADLTVIFFAGEGLAFGRVRRRTPSLNMAS